MTEDVKWPFRTIRDEYGNYLNIRVLTAPFRSDEDYETYLAYAKEGPVIGFTSYQNWPFAINNPHEDRYVGEHDHNYIQMLDAWCHCFPDWATDLLKPGIDMAESDFVIMDSCFPAKDKITDFTYVCLPDGEDYNHDDRPADGWQAWNRNWELAQKCFDRMGDITGILVGREMLDCEDRWNVTTTDYLKWDEYKELVAASRFLFVPNVYDASPRVITEAMAMNVPVLMNRNILGGWKYINRNTGEFFTNENDFWPAVQRIMTGQYYPRSWIDLNYGRLPSGRRLHKFLRTLFPFKEFEDCEMAFLG